MIRRPITFREKVYARFTPRSRSECWWWRGSFKEGRPAINLRHVTRYIYEQEVAPIPPGMVLIRTDHGPTCQRRERCVHYGCVNPYHFRLVPSRGGIYQRESEHDLESSDRAAAYKRRVRANTRKRDTSDTDQAEPENPEGLAPQ